MDKRRVTLLADPTHVIGSLGFERKCRKSWLAQFSSGISNKGIDKWNKDENQNKGCELVDDYNKTDG